MSSYPAEIRCRDQGHTSQRQQARLLDANPAVSLKIMRRGVRRGEAV
jgi:hypothetical protein